MQPTLSLRTRPGRAVVGLAGVLGAVALVAAGCSSDGDASGKPAATASAGGATKVDVTLTAATGTDACELSTSSVPAGPVTFTVTNKDSAAINEVEVLLNNRIVGEKENLVPGLAAVSFTSTLDGGSYEVYCPGAEQDTVAFTVTGDAAAAATGSVQAILAEGTAEYATFVQSQLAAMVVGVANLKKAVDAGDLEAAQQAYATARPFYEKIESDVDGFVLPGFKATDNKGNLDYLIDMRASSFDPAVGWHGIHAVERDLFGAKKIDAIKRHILLDAAGRLLAVHATAANVQDRAASAELFDKNPCTTLAHVRADKSHTGQVPPDAAATAGIELEIVAGPKPAGAFVVQPRRWVVAHANRWINRHRRLARQHEVTLAAHEAFVILSQTRLRLRRLDRRKLFDRL